MNMRQRAVAISAAISAAYLLLIGGTPLGMAIPEVRIASLGLATLWLGGWVLVAWKQPEWRPRSVFLPVIALALGTLAISTALSRLPRTSAEGLAQAVIFGCGYLLLVELLRRPQYRTRVLFAAAAIGVAIAVAYVELIGLEWALFWQLVGRITTPPLRPDFASLVYWNPAPVLALAVLLCLIVIGLVPGTRRGALVAATCTALALLTALLTGTRAGWVAIVGAIALVALLAVGRPEARTTVASMARWLGRSRSRLWSSAVGLAIGLMALVTLAPGLLRRLEAGGEEVRSSFFFAAIRMFESAPLIGLGPGLWPIDRASYTAPGEVDEFVVDAHNVYLQHLAAGGLVGAVIVVLGVLILGQLLRDGLRDRDERRRRWAWLACLACAYMALHQLLVSFLNIPAVLLAAALPVAMLDAGADGPRLLRVPTVARLAHGGRAAAAVGTAALVLALAFAWWTIPATAIASQVARAVDVGDWRRASELSAQARDLDVDYPQYSLLHGLAAAHTGDDAGAAAEFSWFASLTNLSEAWVNLAELRLRAGDTAGAKDALHRAARLGLQHPAVAVAIADVAIRAGDDIAIRAGAEAMARAPSLAGDPWWAHDPERARLLPDMLTLSLDVAGSARRWEILLMSGDTGAASAAVSMSPDPRLAQAVIDAWGGDPIAARDVFERCDADPLDGPIGWCARLASRDGRVDEAARYRRIATMLHIDPNTTHELRIMPVLSRPSTAGDITYKASGLSERNLALWDILVPGLPRIDLVG